MLLEEEKVKQLDLYRQRKLEIMEEMLLLNRRSTKALETMTASANSEPSLCLMGSLIDNRIELE